MSHTGTGTPAVAADTANFVLGAQGWQLQMGGAGTASFYFNPAAGGLPPAFAPPPIAAIGMAVYIDTNDLANLTSLTFNITGNSVNWANSLYSGSIPPMASGWNYIRFAAISSTFGALSNITRLRADIIATGATNVTIGQVWAECPPKAQLMVISDSAYCSRFTNPVCPGVSAGGIRFNGGYPDLKALGIPCVFAVDTAIVGSTTGSYVPPADRASWAQLAALMGDGNGNEMNYHGSSGAATQNMTADQIVVEIVTAIKTLQQQGYPNPPVKAAWSQNEATNAAAARPYMIGYRSPSGSSGSPVGCWPPVNTWNIPSQQLDSDVDWVTAKARLLATHGICITYIHGVDPAGVSGGFDGTTLKQWGDFLDFAADGLRGGWLEAVTFNSLLARSGYKYRQTEGAYTYDYVDTAGTGQHVKLP